MLTGIAGMNPFIEDQEWDDFHPSFNVALAEILGQQIVPNYVARNECRIYMECEEEEHRETYLVIRHVETQQVVTVIETLSPANKRRGSDGHREYLNKRNQILKSQCSLVEIDLLRGGNRMPMRTRLPSGDYYAILCPRWRRPKASIHAWRLRDPMPAIAIPLKKEDGFVEVNLQQVANTVYERADYDLTLDYSRPLHPPLDPGDQDWIQSLALPSRQRPPQ